MSGFEWVPADDQCGEMLDPDDPHTYALLPLGRVEAGLAEMIGEDDTYLRGLQLRMMARTLNQAEMFPVTLILDPTVAAHLLSILQVMRSDHPDLFADV